MSKFPSIEDNFTRTPNVWYDEYLPDIKSLAESKVIEFIIRKT
jgi:hypothetical protein